MKILIISHNPISTYNNMGKTLSALFDCFRREDLCQFYIYPSVPDTNKCGSYYRITDRDILKSYFRLKVKGREIEPDFEKHISFETANDMRFYKNQKNKKPFRMLARDIMWRLSSWYADVNDWIVREKPDKIFVAPGDAKFIYHIAMKISRKHNIPIFTYICDDYFFIEKPKKILEKICWASLRNTIKELMLQTTHVITICDSLKKEYSEYFNVSATTIMTAADSSVSENICVSANPKTITYMGNLRCNRYLSLIEVGKALDELNKKSGTQYQLKIYSAEKDNEILSCFDEACSIEFCGFVTGEEFDKVFHSAEILLHVEAFDKSSIDLVKHSISTKIANALSSGIPLLAYGPSRVASMKHLIDNKCAIVACDITELKEKLNVIFNDTTQCYEVSDRALKTVQKYHNTIRNGEELKRLLL